MTNSKTLVSYIFSIVLCFAAFSSKADVAQLNNKYDAYITGTYYSADLSDNGSYSPSLKVSDSVLNGNIRKSHQEIIQLYTDLRDIRHDLENEIKDFFEDNFLHYSWLRFSITGPIEVKLTGLGNNKIQVNLSKFSVYARVKAENSWWLNVYATMNMPSAEFVAELDIYTGELSNMQLLSNYSIDLDSSIDYLLPGFSNIFTIAFNFYFDDPIGDALTTLDGTVTALALENVIPVNEYVYNGVDFGKEIIEHLDNMLDGEFIHIVANDFPLVQSPKAHFCVEPNLMSWYEAIAEVNVSNRAYMRIGRDINQNCVWNGSGGQPDY
ncbi:hypothetical protein [Paraferrimonas haliotis]|uniref:Uncharacterized protein n=1 Tax=Paraferrimonas haliotis TaxID=2013866 RepID=A0AA37WXB3_9GAMM|nr:hypothetical protein [Paraferrimonas haliotis]GLS83239.1 hypothetical protein GCM10007894_12160 [Paraferrimonas haliotis]